MSTVAELSGTTEKHHHNTASLWLPINFAFRDNLEVFIWAKFTMKSRKI